MAWEMVHVRWHGVGDGMGEGHLEMAQARWQGERWRRR